MESDSVSELGEREIEITIENVLYDFLDVHVSMLKKANYRRTVRTAV
jgi:hypothetical protein